MLYYFLYFLFLSEDSKFRDKVVILAEIPTPGVVGVFERTCKDDCVWSGSLVLVTHDQIACTCIYIYIPMYVYLGIDTYEVNCALYLRETRRGKLYRNHSTQSSWSYRSSDYWICWESSGVVLFGWKTVRRYFLHFDNFEPASQTTNNTAPKKTHRTLSTGLNPREG